MPPLLFCFMAVSSWFPRKHQIKIIARNATASYYPTRLFESLLLREISPL
jgi:hypothetical protein